MQLTEFILQKRDPAEEAGGKIPWDEPGFSERILASHLSQDHDWASRRKEIIHSHVHWIAGRLPVSPAAILDLGCGPGLYTRELAALGHACVGVDISPASIRYAKEQAKDGAPALEYFLGDIRHYEDSRGFDCILLTFGEFNVFTVKDAQGILERYAAMLRPGGIFVLEAHTLGGVRDSGLAPTTWEKHAQGLFSDKPHLLLEQNSWDEVNRAARTQYALVDGGSAEVSLFGSFLQGYTHDQYITMLEGAGMRIVELPDADQWPPGKDFNGKLQVYLCDK